MVGWLVGCLRVKFKEAWEPAVKGIRACLEGMREECWEGVWRVLVEEGSDDLEEEVVEEEEMEEDMGTGEERILKEFKDDVGGALEANATTDLETVREYAFKGIWGETAVKMTAVVVPQFLEWMKEVYWAWNDKDPDR